MAAQQPHFSPRQLANALHASESSVKRWCDQGAIPTIRTVGGHRRITLDGLQHFLQTSNQTLLAPEALGLAKFETIEPVSVPGNADPDQQTFRDSLAKGDEAACRRVLRSRLAAGEAFGQTADYFITDAMHGFGEAWQCNELDAYQERRGCDICIRLINELRSELPRLPATAPIAIGGTPPNDPYQLPTALIELSLREIGWNATSLGSNLPIDSLLQAVRDCSPQMVWLSVSAIEDRVSFVSQEHRLAEGLGDDVSLLIGGRALDDDVRSKLQYTGFCDSLKSLGELASMIRLNTASKR
ncbi:MAG: helix-turn-helix domain-containing protein [Rubripirellula sp.]